MAHINHIRNVSRAHRMSLGSTVSGGAAVSFGAFCGTAEQRAAVGLHEIGRCCGRKGVVLVHNDPAFEAQLGRIYQMFPDVRRAHPSFQMYLANRRGELYYDPLYGLPERAVLDAIVPPAGDSGFFSESQSLRSALSDYLEILRALFEQESGPFGRWPFNLSFLLTLTRMPYSEMYNSVLAPLPQQVRDELAGRLSADGVQQRAFAAVRAFSQRLSGVLWRQDNAADHTGLSIVEAVRTGNLISVCVPGSRREVLDYLAVELDALNDAGAPYLLVTSGINLNNSPAFKRIFLDVHTELPYTTGILAEDTSSVAGAESREEDLTALFTQTQELFVFACSSTLAAEPFSSGVGRYYRQVSEQHVNRQRQPFHIFSAHGTGQSQREVQQLLIDPEELTGLRNGCLLYGANYPIPVLVDEMDLQGGGRIGIPM